MPTLWGAPRRDVGLQRARLPILKDSTVKRLSALHRWIHQLTKGSLGSRLVDNDMLLLTTTGAVSGEPHTVPLLYLRHGDDFVVVASYGGRPRHPQWYLNLLGDPKAVIAVKGDEIPVEARTTIGSERSELWEKVVNAYDGYSTYQKRTDREIPIVALGQR